MKEINHVQNNGKCNSIDLNANPIALTLLTLTLR